MGFETSVDLALIMLRSLQASIRCSFRVSTPKCDVQQMLVLLLNVVSARLVRANGDLFSLKLFIHHIDFLSALKLQVVCTKRAGISHCYSYALVQET